MPLSGVNNFVFENIDVTCKLFLDNGKSDQYYIIDFGILNSVITDYCNSFDTNAVDWVDLDNFNYYRLHTIWKKTFPK